MDDDEEYIADVIRARLKDCVEDMFGNIDASMMQCNTAIAETYSYALQQIERSCASHMAKIKSLHNQWKIHQHDLGGSSRRPSPLPTPCGLAPRIYVDRRVLLSIVDEAPRIIYVGYGTTILDLEDSTTLRIFAMIMTMDDSASPPTNRHRTQCARATRPRRSHSCGAMIHSPTGSPTVTMLPHTRPCIPPCLRALSATCTRFYRLLHRVYA